MADADSEPQLQRLDTSGASGYLHRGSWALHAVERHEAMLAPTVAAQGEARVLLRRWMGHVDHRVAEDVTLLACELISNAVRHVEGPEGREITLHLARGAGVIRVEVCDGGAPFAPRLREAGEDGGFGLLLVDRISRRWGVAEDEPSCIWFEVTDPSGPVGTGPVVA